MSDIKDRDNFLTNRTRFAMLSTLRKDGSPITVPVWFEWDGEILSMFCAVTSAKLSRIKRDPRISVLVANDVDEPEYWVSFAGNATVEENGGFELAEHLAQRYWDLTNPQRSETLELWRSFRDLGFRKVILNPERILTHQPDQPPETK